VGGEGPLFPSKNPEDADPGEDGALGLTVANAY
jgi:hypothetical protein